MLGFDIGIENTTPTLSCLQLRLNVEYVHIKHGGATGSRGSTVNLAIMSIKTSEQRGLESHLFLS